jgi:SAM-dependent methyltransferase
MNSNHSAGEKTPAPVRKTLSTGFRDVDRSGDTNACTRCLDFLADLPFFNEIKQESFRIIAGTRPDLVLDAGCGAGVDLCALAGLMPEKSWIAGIDISAALLATAAGRTSGISDRCSILRGDLVHIPCRNDVFSACRIDRVLQHTADPGRVIHELTRVTRPGGTIVAFDNDWDTFSLGLDNQDLAHRISHSWSTSFAAGRVGRDLPGIFRECGLEDIRAEPRTLSLTDLTLAEQVFDLPHLLEQMGNSGKLTPADAAGVRDELRCRDKEGTFRSGYTGFLVWGRRPE